MNKNYNFNDISNVMHECFDNDIKIYPVVYDKLHFKIEIDFAGRKKLGKEKYNWKTQQKDRDWENFNIVIKAFVQNI